MVAGPSCRYVEPRDQWILGEVGSHFLRHRSSSREQTPTSREVNRLLMQPHICWAKGPRLLVASIIWLSEGGISGAMPVDWVISARPGGPGGAGVRRGRIHVVDKIRLAFRRPARSWITDCPLLWRPVYVVEQGLSGPSRPAMCRSSRSEIGETRALMITFSTHQCQSLDMYVNRLTD